MNLSEEVSKWLNKQREHDFENWSWTGHGTIIESSPIIEVE